MDAQAELRVGLWLSLPSPEVAEMVAGTGFEFVLIDLEHAAIGIETMQRMLMAFAASPTLPFVRVPEGTEAWLKRVLDAGAAGVMVPRVEDADTAARLAGWVTYGPEGRRGEGLSAGRAAAWGRDVDGYRRRWRGRGGLILQIESPAGLAAAAEIAAVPGVTQLFFGPSDFSASLGTGRDDPRVLDAARRVAAVARAAGREAGSTRFPGAGFAGLAAMGFTHAADLNDIGLLLRGLDGHRAEARADSALRKGELDADPRGLILEAYRMQLGPEDCRTIFLDWTLGLPEGAGTAEIEALLAHYGTADPTHPMTAVLRDGLRQAPPPRRLGRAARLRRRPEKPDR